jgi:hypothetical protein
LSKIEKIVIITFTPIFKIEKSTISISGWQSPVFSALEQPPGIDFMDLNFGRKHFAQIYKKKNIFLYVLCIDFIFIWLLLVFRY